MFPHERSLVKRLEGKPFALIGVNSDPDRDKLKEMNQKEQITWRSFWNGPAGTRGPIAQQFGISGWPTIFLFDARGVDREKWGGSPGNEKLDAAIDKLIAEMEGEGKQEPVPC